MVHDFSLIDHLKRKVHIGRLRHKLFPKCTHRNGCLSVVYNDDFPFLSYPLCASRWMGLMESCWKFSSRISPDFQFFNGFEVFHPLSELHHLSCLKECATEIEFPGGCFLPLSSRFSVLDVKTSGKLFHSLVKVGREKNGKYIEFHLRLFV